VLVGLFASLGLAAQRAPLKVCATTPDLASLAELLLGEHGTVTSFTAGDEDPHFLEARPSMVRRLHDADVLVLVGLDLEIGWLPVLLDNARNAEVRPGSPGHIDASAAITKLGVPTGRVDRSMGDVHVGGNPHFLLDPRCGLQVAELLRQRLGDLRPDLREPLAAAHLALRRRLAEAMVGAEVAALYDHDADKLALLFEHDKLLPLLRDNGDAGKLGGWFSRLQRHRGAAVVADHDLWPYFARRFGLDVIGFLEPKPGIAPTTRHLEQLVGAAKRAHVRAVLSVPYFAPQHAEFMARTIGGAIAPMAHQVGARPGCDDYLAVVDHNVTTLAAVLDGKQ
jgi:ABC-type Zn uptake system ZnuABC Zn-binding protein ZnuA